MSEEISEPGEIAQQVDRFLDHIADRDNLIRWIEEQPQGSDILILSHNDGTHSYIHSTGMTVERANYILDVRKNYFVTTPTPDDEDDDDATAV